MTSDRIPQKYWWAGKQHDPPEGVVILSKEQAKDLHELGVDVRGTTVPERWIELDWYRGVSYVEAVRMFVSCTFFIRIEKEQT